MKVLVIGDSYGLPRYAKNSFNVELDYAGTYPEPVSYTHLTLPTICSV